MAPLFLAIPRKSGSRQTTAPGRSEYQRTAPSSVAILALVGRVGWFPRLLRVSPVDTMRLIDRSILARGDEQITFNSETVCYVRIPIEASIPFSCPPISVCFNGQTPPGLEEEIEDLGGYYERIVTSKTNTYQIPRPTIDYYQKLATYPSIDNTHTAPSGFISIPSIISYLKLRTRLTLALGHINIVAEQNQYKNIFEFVTRGTTVTRDDKTLQVHVEIPRDPASAAMEEGEVEPKTIWNTGDADHSTLLIHHDALMSGRRHWGTAEKVPQGPGLFIPYEQNYSQTDLVIINSFVLRYRGLFIDDTATADADLADIVYNWQSEISKTMAGERMAHLMKCMEIAEETYSGLFVIVKPGGAYEGCVILGDNFALKQVGMKITTPLERHELENELDTWGFHEVVLRNVLKVMSLPQQKVESMRHLRSLVMKEGMPGGPQKNQIEKLIPGLSFEEESSPVNPSTLKEAYKLLLSSDPIPDSVFLGFEDFFAEDRTRLVLAMFGQMVPSFSFGGNRRRATPKKAKGTGGIDAYSPIPPAVLQTKNVPISSAIQNWNSMMQTGIISNDFTSKVTGSRVYSGPAKGDVWKALGEFLDKTVVEAGPSITAKVGDKRSRREDDSDAAARVSKLARLF